MSAELIDTVVVGAGQAGVAMSEHLTRCGVEHIVLEKGRIAESWRSRRWDSLVANGPAWHDRFPGMTFDADEDAFIGKEGVAEYFSAYAARFAGEIRTGTEVTRVTRLAGCPGFRLETSSGVIETRQLVVATGAFQKPAIPPVIPAQEGLSQIHSSAYFNPEQLADGGVLVVGAGSSGVQIAQEIAASGRRTFLSVGPHERPPRSYRGRDFVWWLGVLGKWDMPPAQTGTDHVTIAVSGADGGRTIDFRNLASESGITLLGMTEGMKDGRLQIAGDLARNIMRGDENHLALLDEADRYIAANGLDLPEEPEARQLGALPDCVLNPLRELDLAAEGIRTVVWATGFTQDFSWLELDTFDAQGRPQHTRGAARERGLYFLGLPGLTGRGSSFIWGVWHDARQIAEHICIQKSYHAYGRDTA